MRMHEFWNLFSFLNKKVKYFGPSQRRNLKTQSDNRKAAFWCETQTAPSTKTLMFLAQVVLFRLLQWHQVLWVSCVNLYSYYVLLTPGDCNSREKRSTDHLCQAPTSNQPPVLHSLMKPPEHYRRGDLLASYVNIGYAVQPRKPRWK